ncbi:hypothetical protein CEXT_540901 [Caerostris extrusa]|uniref:Uncharacterized protein n=1 Tax=Caerostris extrusa TaxID=172846 RepID=A0AAV4U639_CAEEX|nr:hypothetical protein CEXT_540901 [Caerostris extrusa]
MSSFRICGPKSSICILFLSFAGVVMLSILGILISYKSPAFAEDFEIEEIKHDFAVVLESKAQEISHNCLLAAALYAVTMAFATWQYILNRRAGTMEAFFFENKMTLK